MTDIATPGGTDTTYPLSTQLNITFSPYEDRLIVKSKSGNKKPIVLLLSRRMVIIVLQQLLAKLPDLNELDKTPAQYWQEVLQMAHQQAMQVKAEGNKAEAQAPAIQKSDAETSQNTDAQKQYAIYLATEFTVKLENKRLMLAFRGLQMPQAMTVPSAPEPVFALPLLPVHAHQLIQLLINKSQDAHWHLPLNLPWLENPPAPSTSLGVPSVH